MMAGVVLQEIGSGNMLANEFVGQNSQIPRFDKICSKLALFRKYLVIYHFFSTRVSQNRVLNSTQVSSELLA